MRRRSLAGVLSDSDEAAPEARAQQGRNQLLLAQLRRSLATVAIKDGKTAIVALSSEVVLHHILQQINERLVH